MIEYEKMFEAMEMHCDSCSHGDTHQGSWLDCIDQFKDDGWKVESDGKGGYNHICPSCLEEDPMSDMEDSL